MMTMNKKIFAVALALMLAVMLPGAALADDWYGSPGGFYTVSTDNGQALFTYAGEISVDDEYISGDNKRYRVVQVDNARRAAVARFVEDVVLWEGFDEAMDVNAPAQGKKKVGLYCSHTDESYIPGDGTEAKPEKGGILDVAGSLGEELKKRGIDATVDTTSHDPHDAGAYRRSRSSAMNLMESKQPDLLLDIHRDGVPNASEYGDTIKGQPSSKVRFVVGRSNQNKAANEDTAKKMKQIADKSYPGLVKDIYIGKGSYNQDLTPNSMLIELGTHTIEKDRVLNSTGYMADVIAQYLGVSGGQGQANQSAASGQSAEPQAQQQGAQNNRTANRTAAGTIAWIIGIIGALSLLFLLIAVSKGHRMERVGNFFKEVTGTGKHRDKDDK